MASVSRQARGASRASRTAASTACAMATLILSGSAGDDRQGDVGGAPGVVEDGLVGEDEVRLRGGRGGRAVAGIAVVAGEVRTGDVHPQPVAGLEDLAGGDQVDPVLVGSPRGDRPGPVAALAVAGAHDAVHHA